MVLDRIKKDLEEGRSRLGASSGTFYIRDPFWHDEFRLIAMPGVRLTEPMHGFSFPPHSKRILVEGNAEIFSATSESNQQLREDASAPLDRIDPQKQFLFGDFVAREGIKSSARLLHIEGGRIEAILFVNFDFVREFDDRIQDEIRKLLASLVGDLSQLRNEIRISETDALVQAIRIFPPTHTNSDSQLNEWDQPLDEYLLSLLDLAIHALELDPNTTFGTVHLFDQQTGTLNLAAYTDAYRMHVESARAPQSVPAGEGVISWVALRRKALLIADLETSEFKSIHIPHNSGMRSEVAIPIFAGNELVGVLDLESVLPNTFIHTCVRSLWFAVNRAAVAYRLWQQVNINERLKNLTDGLLELCGEVVDKGTGDFSLNRLAGLAAEQLQAARCGIWHYNAQDAKFELAGVSSPDFKPNPPRSNGLSSFIRRFGQPVWIRKEDAGLGLLILYWNGNEWEQPSAELNTPAEINLSVKPGVKSLVAIPIKVRGQFTGIAWLEYENNPETSSGRDWLKLASGFAAYAGLVIEFSLFDLVDKNAVQRIGERLFMDHLASGPLKLEGFPQIEGYVKSQPYPSSRIGGDFYAARVIDERTASVLVGDGMGHSVTGALNMLPLLTVFEAFWKESRSAMHLMDKIMSVSNKLGVQGTAIYCVFSLREKTLWLSVTSAGHPPLVIVKKDGRTLPFPEDKHPARGGMLGAMLEFLLAEQLTELSSGDLLIISTDGFDMGTQQMTAVGLTHYKEDPRAIAEAVFQEAIDKRTREGKSVDDDQTVLVIRIK